MELTVQISQEHSSTQVLSLVYGLFPSHPTLCPWHLWFSDLKLLRVSTFPFVKSKFWKFQISSKTNLEHFWLAIWALYKLIFDFGLMTYFENIKVLLISTLSECFPYWAFDHSCLEFMNPGMPGSSTGRSKPFLRGSLSVRSCPLMGT